MAPITLQILHASDFEAGLPALDDAVRFSAVLNALRPTYANTLTLSSGDNYIPGPFFNASSDPSLNGVGGLGSSSAPVIGRADIGILNAFGIQASALGNHEFDLGTRQVRDILRSSSGNPGTNFPYLSANLNFAPDENLSTEVTDDGQEASTIPRKLAKSAVITVPGADGIEGTADDETIGIVGATTPTLRSISSPGNVGVTPANPTDYAALAAEIQTSVDALTATGIDKVILLAHMQQLFIEADELAPRLRDVDVIIAGGSHTLLTDSNDVPRTGETGSSIYSYPTVRTSPTGQPVLVVNTGANYEYVGRLVADFDANGVINLASLNNTINGAYATDEAGVDRVYGTDVNPRTVANPNVVAITDALRTVIVNKDSNIFGKTSVFLNGTRESVRTQETNLGNLSSDANLAEARKVDRNVVLSIRNGGGIRDNIGSVSGAGGATNAGDVERLPPPANPQANKQQGDVSQLDIENSLRFNNNLSLITVTAAQLQQVMEHSVAGTRPGATPGQFPQIGGIAFSFDPSQPAIAFNTLGNVTTTGTRVRSLAIRDGNDNVIDTVVENGQLVGDPNRPIRLVTLNFLASGGDGYPFPFFVAANPAFANRVDLAGEDANNNGVLDSGEDTNRNALLDAPVITDPGAATFSRPGSEQDALAEYLAANFRNTPYNAADTSPAQDGRVQNLSVRSDDTVLASSGLTRDANNIFTTNGILSSPNLLFRLTGVNTSFVDEIGVFAVDDALGTVNGIAPGQVGYLQAALSEATVVFSAISNRPSGFGTDNLTRIISSEANARLVFYLVRNSTTDTALADIAAGQTSPDVFFGTPSLNANGTSYLQVSDRSNGVLSLGWEDSSGSPDFNDVLMTVETTDRSSPLGSGLQGGEQQEGLDLRTQAGQQIRGELVLNREAAYDNFVGLYKVVDTNGGIDVNGDGSADILPGDAGYARTAVQQRVASLGLTVGNQSTSSVTGQLEGGFIYAPFIIADGRPDALLDDNSTNDPAVYFPYLQGNSDRADHLRLLGDNVWGFEDLPGGGDADYNDMIIQLNLTVA